MFISEWDCYSLTHNGDSYFQMLIILVIVHQCAHCQLLYVLRANFNHSGHRASFLYCLRLLYKFIHGKTDYNTKTGSTLRETKNAIFGFCITHLFGQLFCVHREELSGPHEGKKNKRKHPALSHSLQRADKVCLRTVVSPFHSERQQILWFPCQKSAVSVNILERTHPQPVFHTLFTVRAQTWCH